MLSLPYALKLHSNFTLFMINYYVNLIIKSLKQKFQLNKNFNLVPFIQIRIFYKESVPYDMLELSSPYNSLYRLTGYRNARACALAHTETAA